jgi:nucleoside 2-deoxyribosyltransferase
MMAPRVYVAGSSRELERAERVIAEAQRRGFIVTQDWPAAVRAAGASNEGLTHEQRTSAARECMRGVHTADAVVLLVPAAGVETIGAWFELGYAVSRGLRVFASTPAGREESTVFLALHAVSTLSSDQDALDAFEMTTR